MKTPTPEQARDALAAAEAEKTEAEELAAALADKVRAGDDTVTPKDLTAARELADFADLRITAARRKMAAAEDADRHARAEQVAAEVGALVEQEDSAELAAKMRAAVDALADLYAATAARRERILGMTERVKRIGAELELAGVAPAHEVGKRYGVAADHDTVWRYQPQPVACVGITPALAVAAAIGLAVPNAVDQAAVSEKVEYLSSKAEDVLRQVPAVRAEFALAARPATPSGGE
ncbi:hypothetical protein [Streptomyces sp. NPDC001530]|uniref:hypothetical protein n=1 Tax=Streptomyces sp. NPDC001530 TaxID=3364582 RepID=UPI0036AFB241